MRQALAVRDDDDRPAGPVKRGTVPTIDPEDSRAYTWYALRVAPQRELSVQRILDDQGFATFVAVRKAWEFGNRAGKGRWEKREVIRPIMPGWCFVGMNDWTPGWARIVWIPLITGIVSWGGRPMVIPHDQTPIYDKPKGDPTRKIVGHRDGLRKLMWEQARGMFNAPDYEKWQDTQHRFKAGDEVVTAHEDDIGQKIKAKVIEITDRRCKLLLERGLFGGAVREVEADATTLRKVE